ncbi:MAG: hypothetical protein ACPHAN_11380 [Pseudomonadales bacterium]
MSQSEYFRPNGVNQVVAFDASAATSTAVSDGCFMVEVVCSQNAYIAIAATPTATASNGMYIQKDWPYFIKVNPGEKVAAIKVATAGNMYVSELTE